MDQEKLLIGVVVLVVLYYLYCTYMCSAKAEGLAQRPLARIVRNEQIIKNGGQNIHANMNNPYAINDKFADHVGLSIKGPAKETFQGLNDMAIDVPRTAVRDHIKPKVNTNNLYMAQWNTDADRVDPRENPTIANALESTPNAFRGIQNNKSSVLAMNRSDVDDYNSYTTSAVNNALGNALIGNG